MVTVARVQRVKAGLSQSQVCQIVGCSRRWLSFLERGMVRLDHVDYFKAVALASILGVPFETLADEVGIDTGGNDAA